MKRRRRFVPSPTYGQPHPDLQAVQENSLFSSSVYDAAPEHVRKRSHEDPMAVFDWFYKQTRDPRPFNERYAIPEEYDFPPFPWENPSGFLTLADIFG